MGQCHPDTPPEGRSIHELFPAHMVSLILPINLHHVKLQDLRKEFAETPDIKVFDTVIKRAIRHELAQSDGEPNIDKAPEYLSFVKEVLAIA